MYVFDTNILIYYLEADSHVAALIDTNEVAALSIISYVELLGKPSLSKSDLDQLQSFLQTFRVIDLNTEIGEKAAFFRRKGLKLGDAVIAATAFYLDAPLVTHDKDFASLPGVKLLDPFKS